MPEVIAQVAGMFGGASGLFKTLKDASNAFREAKNLELYERMLPVYGDVMELVEKNRELVEENQSLKDMIKTKQKLVHDGERYWADVGGGRDGPFCSTCWDIDSKLVRMRAFRDGHGELDYTCDYCGRYRTRR